MKIVLAFAALITVTLASPVENRALSPDVTKLLKDLEAVIQCVSQVPNILDRVLQPLLASARMMLKNVESILQCPVVNSDNIVAIFEGASNPDATRLLEDLEAVIKCAATTPRLLSSIIKPDLENIAFTLLKLKYELECQFVDYDLISILKDVISSVDQKGTATASSKFSELIDAYLPIVIDLKEINCKLLRKNTKEEINEYALGISISMGYGSLSSRLQSAVKCNADITKTDKLVVTDILKALKLKEYANGNL
ncbi:hypothetical protein FQA39_LY12195 [Lamprigera yunnana]|nr:hypothetical protein FQA39_LY12195 [Lamprigera yunnana]